MSPRMETTGPDLSSPAWASDFRGRDHLVPGGARIDPAQFHAPDAVQVVADGNAAASATSISCDALSGPIPSGTLLDFGAGKYAKLTAAAAAAATSISVEALPAQIDDNDAAWYAGVEKKSIPSGTVIGRTFAERGTGDAFGPADASDDEIYLTAFAVTDADINANVELYRPGSVVKENFLPGWSDLATAIQALVRSHYTTQSGQN